MSAESSRPVDVTLQPVTKETLQSVLGLKVAPGQEKFVASNAVSIAEAHFEERAWFRAVFAGGDPVGFVMLYLDTDMPHYFVWRLMVDRERQGRGYGRRAMERVITHVRTLPGAETLWVSYVPGEGDPAFFYRKLGFEETGKVHDGEKLMKLILL